MVTITEPGVYQMSPDEYHSHTDVLSSTGARRLLLPSCPAKFRYLADHGQESKPEFDLGHAAHRLVLGDGADLVVIATDSYRTKAAQAARDEAYATGRTPLLSHEDEQVQAMAAALREHPDAVALFEPDTGRPEQSLFWVDAEFGVWRRARLDWLRNHDGNGRLIIPDYKTAHSVEPAALSKALADHHYNQQAAWYEDAVTALGLAGDQEPVFLLVCQEKSPPYLITICQPDHVAIKWGRLRNRKALDVYRRCQATGRWPGYTDKPIALSLPRWAEYQQDAAFERGDYDIEGSS